MNKNAKKWVRALRSGKWQRTAGALRTGDKYCCLGVACEISGLGIWDRMGRYISGDSSDLRLPKEVMEWLGMDSDDGQLDFGGTPTSLAVLNDSGKTFKQIANIIEKKAGQLFVPIPRRKTAPDAESPTP